VIATFKAGFMTGAFFQRKGRRFYCNGGLFRRLRGGRKARFRWIGRKDGPETLHFGVRLGRLTLSAQGIDLP